MTIQNYENIGAEEQDNVYDPDAPGQDPVEGGDDIESFDEDDIEDDEDDDADDLGIGDSSTDSDLGALEDEDDEDDEDDDVDENLT